MLINLAFIKAINGMFYFAMDYLAELESTVRIVLVRAPEVANAVRQRFPNVEIKVVNGRQAARAVWAAGRTGEMTFTPSSHPIPFCSRQMVVVHDTFPFERWVGAVKAVLFFASMHSGKATAAYINKSDARAFLLAGGLAQKRLRSSPNRMVCSSAAPLEGALIVPDEPIIGLFGTDSPKKNYEQLFTSIMSHPPGTRLKFRAFGKANPYIADIMARFPDLDIALTQSTNVDLEAFVRSVDLIVSAATREGFSRPIALALSLGIPAWIVDGPVFREFYGGAASLHPSISALGQALTNIRSGDVVRRPDFALPSALKHDFEDCIAWLKAQDAGSK